jgi:hypothetical protein
MERRVFISGMTLGQRPDRSSLNSRILCTDGWPQVLYACRVAVRRRTTCDTEDEAQS